MSVKETAAAIEILPEPADVTYQWTYCGIGRSADQVNLPLTEQSITLTAECVATIDGAGTPIKGKTIRVQLSTEELLALNATMKTIIKKFVGLCEAGCKQKNQTYTDDVMQ